MKIDHVQLAMPPNKENAARAFFSELLGMSEEPKPYPLSQRGGCWFRDGQTIIHVGTEADFHPQRKAHPAFIAEDIQGLAAKLDNANFPVIWDNALENRTRFYTSDPFGNRIEFIQEGDGFTQK